MPSQRYSCHSCGDCCRDFTVQLRKEDILRLENQGYAQKMGEPVTVEFRKEQYLRQREDGACIFLESDGRCRIHSDYGFDEKPVACRLFPFNLAPDAGGPHAGLNFACQSVRANKGAALSSHRNDLVRALRAIPEANVKAPPRLSRKLRAEQDEVNAIGQALDKWLAASVSVRVRFDGFAWLAQSLGAAKFDKVRGVRVKELVDLLVSALPEELEHLPVEEANPRQLRLLRQASFARIEDPRIHDGAPRGAIAVRLDQWRRSRAFAAGRGEVPWLPRGWPGPVRFDAAENVKGPSDSSDHEAIDDLVSRWMRATILGSRAWGAGYYAFSVAEGVQALALNLACVGWLARVHAAGRGCSEVDLEAVGEAIGRIDRAAGRARWLGSSAEKLRMRYFSTDDGLRRIVRSVW